MSQRKSAYTTKREIAVADLPALASEGSLQDHIAELSKKLHLHYYHTWNSLHSPSGFPDVVIMHFGLRYTWLIVAELKREGKQPTTAQEEWLTLFWAMAERIKGDLGVRMHVAVWQPRHWPVIESLLIEAWEDR